MSKKQDRELMKSIIYRSLGEKYEEDKEIRSLRIFVNLLFWVGIFVLLYQLIIHPEALAIALGGIILILVCLIIGGSSK